MGIIERHDLTWTARITCKRCTSVLEVEPTDLNRQPGGGHQLDYTPETFYTTCLVCRARVTLDKTTLPQWVKDRAKSSTGNYAQDR